MFHAQISWNKKRVKTYLDRSSANLPKSKGSTNIYYQARNGCKVTQTEK